ncbi:tetratricopeptide repeat protein [Lentisalinibacter orientalis]|uniref:tetratricopeptide repeat protein n=1 Tax=Lentisalinibacter orientalis TaxID=2992241 RepID=UPI003863C592
MLISAEAERLFLEVLELEPYARDAYLTANCGHNPVLLREVISLVGAAGESEPYFADLAGRIGLGALADDSLPTAVPETVGRWRPLRLVGRGGMGAVYLAERADGHYEAKVALKILPLGLGDAAARERFVAERQILAKLVHENITRLLDGGVTGDGTPYFVMDYVDGRPIDAWCDKHSLPVDDRLALFLSVCEAVQFAHRKLVIHRDIKPANVLVDAAGAVRLLDFGIAKLIDREEQGAEVTRLSRRPLTPTYASPEMLRGEAVDVTTDVYSLGVLCYRLLTGHPPREFPDPSFAGIEAALRATEPPASAAVLRSRQEADGTLVGPEELAARRGTNPRRLAARLTGDLDVILATALAVGKERRYGSVEQFAHDVRRHLEGLPIVARPATAGYRLGKFVRRHRIAIAGGAVAAALLVGITAVSVNHAIVTARQSLEIAAERDRAETVTAFLKGIFYTADPGVSQGADLTAREILERAVLGLTDDSEERPDVRADLLDAVVDVYVGLGFFAEALPLAEEVATLRREIAGEWSAAYADALHTQSYLLEQLGDYGEALDAAGRALELRRAIGAPVPLGDSLIVYARVLHRQGEPERAEPYYREAVALHRSAFAGPDEKLAQSLVSLGTLEKALGRLDEAETLQREALAMRLALYETPATELIESYYNLGTVLHQRELYEQAREAYESALAVGAQLWPKPEGHPDEAFMLNGLARVHESLGEDARAAELFGEASVRVERLLGPDHPNLGIVEANRGRILLRVVGCEAAEAPLERAVSVLEAAAPAILPLALARSRLGRCRLDGGRLDEAESLLQAALPPLRDGPGIDHPETRAVLERLVALYEARGDRERAGEYAALSASGPAE